MVAVASMVTVECRGRTIREVNRAIRQAVAAGEQSIQVRHPEARHSIAVALLAPVEIRIEGSVGYYCGGMGDGPRIEIEGSAGWGLAECLMGGTVVCRGSAGNRKGAPGCWNGRHQGLRGNLLPSLPRFSRERHSSCRE